MQEFEPFRLDLQGHHGDASDVSTGPIKICDETKLDRVGAEIEDDGG